MNITMSRMIQLVIVFCFAIGLAGCGPALATSEAPAATEAPYVPPAEVPAAAPTEFPYVPPAGVQASFSDPFAYCAAVGTMETPDARYSGPEMPEAIVQGMIKLGLVSADAPADFQKNATWRCMDNHVWVCTFGANLPCLEKADTSQTPTAAMDDFCKENPTAEGIPAYVTGRATVYEWACKDGKAVAGEQIFTVDPQGFLADFWYELTPQ